MILYNIHIYIHINVSLVSFYLPFYPILPNVIHVIDVLCTLDRCGMMFFLLIFCDFFQDLAEAAEHEPRFHLQPPPQPCWSLAPARRLALRQRCGLGTHWWSPGAHCAGDRSEKEGPKCVRRCRIQHKYRHRKRYI